MKFPRKLINRDIGPLNSRVVSHLRTINYTMDGTAVIDTRVSVQNPSRVKFFSSFWFVEAFASNGGYGSNDRTGPDHRC